MAEPCIHDWKPTGEQIWPGGGLVPVRSAGPPPGSPPPGGAWEPIGDVERCSKCSLESYLWYSTGHRDVIRPFPRGFYYRKRDGSGKIGPFPTAEAADEAFRRNELGIR